MLTCNTKHAIVLYLFNLQFHQFLSASFVGRNCNMCSYTIKSHDQKYSITLCILINVIEMFELKPITINSAHHYIKGSTVKGRFHRFLECQKCYITYVTCVVRICLICPHLPSGAARPQAHAYISGKSLLPMLHI